MEFKGYTAKLKILDEETQCLVWTNGSIDCDHLEFVFHKYKLFVCGGEEQYVDAVFDFTNLLPLFSGSIKWDSFDGWKLDDLKFISACKLIDNGFYEWNRDQALKSIRGVFLEQYLDSIDSEYNTLNDDYDVIYNYVTILDQKALEKSSIPLTDKYDSDLLLNICKAIYCAKHSSSENNYIENAKKLNLRYGAEDPTNAYIPNPFFAIYLQVLQLAYEQLSKEAIKQE